MGFSRFLLHFYCREMTVQVIINGRCKNNAMYVIYSLDARIRLLDLNYSL